MASQRLTFVLAALAVAWGVASFVSMTYGTLVNWPDYVHTNFGVPFTFAVHTSSTIVGSVDTWDMDINALAADLAFWLTGILAIAFASLARSLRGPVPAPLGVS